MPRFSRICFFACFVVMVAVLTGCSSTNHAGYVPLTDDFVVPPDDPRYNQPPESGYTKPLIKKAWGSQNNGGQMGMGP